MAQSEDGMAMLKRAVLRVPSNSQFYERIRGVLKHEVEAGVHLGVFVEPFLEAILDGRKTIESRFALRRCPPFDRVHAGDLILLKRSGGPIVGIALAGKARYYALDAKKLGVIRKRFASQLYAEDDAFWRARAEKRFATLIEIEQVAEIDLMAVEKRDRRGWVTYINARRQPCLALAG